MPTRHVTYTSILCGRDCVDIHLSDPTLLENTVFQDNINIENIIYLHYENVGHSEEFF